MTFNKTIDLEDPHFWIYSPTCWDCKHRHEGKQTCTAFPDLIPGDIWSGELSHKTSFKGDKGVRYERMDPPPTKIFGDRALPADPFK